ncbi:hypothetical protein K1719_024529 [Acacia pycnantha]|nr:hypothetical protein K1719_024529 [Acacia pycnantha]
MGFSQEIPIDSWEPSNPQNAPDNTAADHDYDYNKLKFRSTWRKMIWLIGFACFTPSRRRRRNNADGMIQGQDKNKAWLLAESGGCPAESTNADPQSVHSSFRFNLCSQVELESLEMSSSAAATVLMVNLDNGVSESPARELKWWWKIDSLNKTIYPRTNNTLIRFNYSEILSATHNFSEGRVLGRGALSCVFRGKIGILRSAVAIKRLDKEDKECAKSFCRELMIASSLHNPNVVPLVGFCADPEGGLFLVYKFVSGGSLERHLHGKKMKGVKGNSPLPWSVRYKVAVGIAEVISYLHNGTKRCVVHRDIKPSNILLSSRKSPKLCDFGIATWTSAPSVHFLCKTVKGTFGYLAPEYFQHGKVSDKTDVYAFGVVLLELITGRKPIEAKRPPGEENLFSWAKPLLQKGKAAIGELLDPQLNCTLKSSNQICQMIEAATACITHEESRRPGIKEIVLILRGEEPISSKRRKPSLSAYGSVMDSYPQLLDTNKDFKGHLALAMLGVSEFEDDDYLFGR